jgi:hypothetical protein
MMAKKMTEAQRKWRDENMEAMREGVKAVKEGRITPADTFFEWMQAKYVRDIWEQKLADLRAENARLQEQVKEAEVLTEVLTEGIKAGLSHLGWRTSEQVHEGEAIEALTGVLSATPKEALNTQMHEVNEQRVLECVRLQERVKAVEENHALTMNYLDSARKRLDTANEWGAGYKAQAERLRTELKEDLESQHHHGPACNWGKLPKPQLCVRCSHEAAIAITPEEAREKEEKCR